MDRRYLTLLTVLGAALLLPLAAMANEGGGDKKKAPTHNSAEGAPRATETSGLGGQKVYVSIGPIIMPIIPQSGPQQIMTMIVSLQVKDTNTSDTVREQLPRLIDAYMRGLYGKIDTRNMHNGTVVDIDFIKARVAKATDEIMGKGIVEDVLIQAVAQRQV